MVTIDTECDSSRWDSGNSGSFSNMDAVPMFQEVFNRHGVKPTYLVTYQAAKNGRCLDTLGPIKKKGKCEVGAHLHPWTTPPAMMKEVTMSNRLGSGDKRRKLDALTEAVESSFGKPRAFRAGRYGMDGEMLRLLEEMGYLVDTSVTPNVSWRIIGGPSFVGAPLEPYYPDTKDIRREGGSSVLEIPITIRLTRNVPGLAGRMYSEALGMPGGSIGGLKGRVLRKVKFAGPVWLRPTYYGTEDMISLCDRVIDEDSPVLNMMFHSNEMAPGTSPFNKTERDVEEFLGKVDKVLHYLINNKKLESRTCSGFMKEMKGV